MDGAVDRTHNYPLGACPYCGREVPASMTDAHATVCIHRPEMQARILAALTSDVPGVGVRQKDYDTARIASGAAHSTSLLRGYGGTWTAVLEAFGLTAPRRRAEMRTNAQQRMTPRQREDAAIDDVAAQMEQARRTLEEERNHGYGLAVAAVLPAPGLSIGGKPCVRYVLR